MTTAIGAYATRALVTPRLSGTFDSAENTLLDGICDQINQEIETVTGRVLAPIGSATYLFDGNGKDVLWVPIGIRAITLLEIAPYTAGTFATVTSTDYVLRPLVQDRRPGWPAMQIRFADIRTGTYSTFRSGYGNIRVTMTAGWAAIPDDVQRIALDAAVRAWGARQVGQPESEFPSPTPTQFLSRRDRELLSFYTNHSI